jgi:hypothetical protein
MLNGSILPTVEVLSRHVPVRNDKNYEKDKYETQFGDRNPKQVPAN